MGLPAYPSLHTRQVTSAGSSSAVMAAMARASSLPAGAAGVAGRAPLPGPCTR